MTEKYKIILADPPWSYDDKCTAGKRGVEYKYPTMSMEDIKSLPVKDIVDDDAILFLWVTLPLLPLCLEIFEAWGFKYKTGGFVWVKKNKKTFSNFWGMGHWTRSNAELCLIGTRGKPKPKSHKVHSIVEGDFVKHSKKPSIIKNKIVELCGDEKRVELFARRPEEEVDFGEKRKYDWEYLGNESAMEDIRVSLNRLVKELND